MQQVKIKYRDRSEEVIQNVETFWIDGVFYNFLVIKADENGQLSDITCRIPYDIIFFIEEVRFPE